ncbi:MAG TPA: proline racemase family protein [Acetobacteraceae bacterium]|jgi:trans-L-3-hydroxyproline dehydratase
MSETAAQYRTVEMHTGGEPVRIVLEGFPEPRGATVLEKRHDAAARLDLHRRRLMLEPRGHPEMYGALIVPAAPPAAFGALFMHHSGFSTMCGHATIALGRWAVASGRVPMRDGGAEFLLECPCGPVAVRVTHEGARVAFDSVPAFAAELDASLEVPGFGRVACDIGYGGAFYAILPAARLGLDIARSPVGELRTAALAVMRAIRAGGAVRHPTEPELSFLYSAILTDGTAAASPGPHRHLCVFGEGQIDRSATGSGVTARMAVDAARGLIAPGARRSFAGASGVPFDAELLAEERLGPHRAWRVRVAGTASFHGTATWTVEDGDPLRDGFAIEDAAPLPAM